MALVAALFSDGSAASEAVSTLNDAGLGDELEVIDRQRLINEYPHDVVLGGTQGTPAGVVADESEGTEHRADMLTRGNIQEFLEARGVDEEEAEWYAHRIQGGDSLLLVDVGAGDVGDLIVQLEAHGAEGIAEV